MSWLGELLKVFQLKPRLFFGIWSFGALVLLLPAESAEFFGVATLRDTYRPWIGVGTLAGIIFWLVQLVPLWRARRSEKEYRNQVINALNSISGNEWVLIAYCLDHNQQTVTLSLVDPTAGSLTARGILQQAQGVGNQLAWPYTIPDFLWFHLRQNREEFFKKVPFPQAEIEPRLEGFKRYLHRRHF